MKANSKKETRDNAFTFQNFKVLTGGGDVINPKQLVKKVKICIS